MVWAVLVAIARLSARNWGPVSIGDRSTRLKIRITGIPSWAGLSAAEKGGQTQANVADPDLGISIVNSIECQETRISLSSIGRSLKKNFIPSSERTGRHSILIRCWPAAIHAGMM